MNSIMDLHSGGHVVTEEQLAKVPTPQSTASWFPVGHSKCVTTVRQSLVDAGFEIQKAQYALARSDARMFATLDLTSPLATGVNLAVGVRNSLDKSFPLGFIAGNRVFVCSNLAFRSELNVARKHSKNGEARFGEAIIHAIRNLTQFQNHERERIRVLQHHELGDRDAESIMLRAYEKNYVSHRLLPRVIKQWREPSFDDFDSRTAWSLLNAFTTVLGERQHSNAQMHSALTMRIGAMLDDFVGIKPLALTQEGGEQIHTTAV